jgi:hypothetical protein
MTKEDTPNIGIYVEGMTLENFQDRIKKACQYLGKNNMEYIFDVYMFYDPLSSFGYFIKYGGRVFGGTDMQHALCSFENFVYADLLKEYQ